MGVVVVFMIFVKAHGNSGPMPELKIESLRLICYIAVIVLTMQLAEMAMKRFGPARCWDETCSCA